MHERSSKRERILGAENGIDGEGYGDGYGEGDGEGYGDGDGDGEGAAQTL